MLPLERLALALDLRVRDVANPVVRVEPQRLAATVAVLLTTVLGAIGECDEYFARAARSNRALILDAIERLVGPTCVFGVAGDDRLSPRDRPTGAVVCASVAEAIRSGGEVVAVKSYREPAGNVEKIR